MGDSYSREFTYHPGRAFTYASLAQLAGGTFIGPNEHRRVLVIGAPQTNRITLGWNGQPPLDQGLTLYPGGVPLVLDRDTYGGMVTGAVFAVSAVADQLIGVTEEIGLP